jgi:hypothetical protein
MADTTTVGGGHPPGTPNTYSPIAAVNFQPGTPVAASITVPGEVERAGTSGGDFSCPTGIAVTTGVVGHHVLVQYAGPISLTTADWDAITGQSGGLTPGIFYYLSTEFGAMTDTPPVGFGSIVAPVGIALSSTDFLVRPTFRGVIV